MNDAEAYLDILTAIENLGKYLSPGTMLAAALNNLPNQLGFSGHNSVSHSSNFTNASNFLSKARNDAAHSGIVARHLTERCIDMALFLETQLMPLSSTLTVAEYMVERPLTADLWETVRLMRRKMLRNNFSYLPYHDSDTSWSLIADEDLAHATRITGRANDDSTLSDLIDLGYTSNRTVHIVKATDAINSLSGKVGIQPTLVLDGNDRLIGILTSFDIL